MILWILHPLHFLLQGHYSILILNISTLPSYLYYFSFFNLFCKIFIQMHPFYFFYPF